MTHTDALSVQVGSSYQFPTLRGYFGLDPETTGIDLRAQRLRFAEVGMQHHFSRHAVLFLGAHQREYTDVVFSDQSPTEVESAFGTRRVPPPGFLETRGIEAVFDHQFHPRLVGQLSVVLSRTLQDEGVKVPWSRRAVIRNWVSWNSGTGWVATVSGDWNSGRPYSICLKPRGCRDSELREGTLPDLFNTDLALRWGQRVGNISLDLRAEIYNLFDRRIPRYEFSAYPTQIGSDNFLAYYHDTGRTDGYVRASGNQSFYFELDNPETRTAGRSFVLGVSAGF
jgi:hypothetical protein